MALDRVCAANEAATRGISGDWSPYVKALHIRAHFWAQTSLAGRFDGEMIRRAARLEDKRSYVACII